MTPLVSHLLIFYLERKLQLQTQNEGMGKNTLASSGHILQRSIAKYMDSLMGEVFEPFFFVFVFNPSTVFFKYKELASGGLSIKN